MDDELLELKRELAREIGTRAALLAENRYYKQRAAELAEVLCKIAEMAKKGVHT